MHKVSYEAYESNEVYDNMDMNPTEKKKVAYISELWCSQDTALNTLFCECLNSTIIISATIPVVKFLSPISLHKCILLIPNQLSIRQNSKVKNPDFKERLPEEIMVSCKTRTRM